MLLKLKSCPEKKLLISVCKVSSILQIIISYDWMNSILSPYCAERTVVSLLDANLQPLQRFGESPVGNKISVQSSRMNLKGYLSAHDGHMVFAPSKLPYLAKYHLEDGTMVKDWNFYFDRSFYECKDYNLLFSKARSFGQVLDLAMDDQYIYILYLDQLLSEYDYNDPQKSMANKVLVFNYSGVPIAKLILDKRIYQMALCTKFHKIIWIGILTDTAFVSFDFVF